MTTTTVSAAHRIRNPSTKLMTFIGSLVVVEFFTRSLILIKVIVEFIASLLRLCVR